jgi:pimeloyl-ACP methyl ester carboxylesterase
VDDPLKEGSKPILCILHGFPTSSYDYWKVFDVFAESYRVIIHDHLGFGFSDKPTKYSYSLVEQTDIALSLWNSLGVNKAIILAHDYGTSILTEILARDNQGFCSINIEKIILCNGSMHIELAQLRLMQKLLRNSFFGPIIAKLFNIKTLGENLKAIYFDSDKLSEQEVGAIWEMMIYNQGRDVIAKISRYTFERQFFWERWIGALRETELPIEIVWPDSDPIAVSKMATVIETETKNSNLHWLKDAGHFPMLEAPKRWSQLVLEVAKLK